jgi:4a-hydroxytetrahydrobiopterin dehydratase
MRNKSVDSIQIWSEIEGKLCKDFYFSDFIEALDFINQLAVICQLHNHHPDIIWTYSKLSLKLSTHDAGDIITEKDIKLAERIDDLIQNR